MKTYVGTTNPGKMDWQVKVEVNGKSRDLPLCLEHVNHSPDGFAWGYGGSGPSQLAFAIVADAVGVSAAKQVYQEFKNQVIAKIPQDDSFKLSWAQVVAAVNRIKKQV